MSGITMNMTDYMKAHPKLKYVFFGGKGGVGKTIMAGAAALWFAQQGKKTLLASTNPVHSLSNLLNQDADPGKDRLVPQICRHYHQGRGIRRVGHHEPGF